MSNAYKGYKLTKRAMTLSAGTTTIIFNNYDYKKKITIHQTFTTNPLIVSYMFSVAAFDPCKRGG